MTPISMQTFAGFPQCAICSAYTMIIHVCQRRTGPFAADRPPVPLCSSCLRAFRKQDWETVNNRRLSFGHVEPLHTSTLIAIWEKVEEDKIKTYDYGVGAD